MNKIILFFTILIIGAANISTTEADVVVIYECTVHKTDHNWWNPADWFTDYDYTQVRHEGGWVLEGSVWVEQTSIGCFGRGDTECPDCPYSITLSDKDTILNENFLDISASMMEDYVIDQINNSVFSGYQSFNTYYNGYPIYRNVSWSGDTTISEVEMILNIVPSINP